VIQDNYRDGVYGWAGQIETAGVLDDGETLTITSLRASGSFLLPESCVGNLCPIEFVVGLSIELDPGETSRLTLRREGGRLLTQGSVHLLLSVLGTTLPATLEVAEFSPLVADFSGTNGSIGVPGPAPSPVPNFASAGLLEFDGLLHFSGEPSWPLSSFRGLGLSAVPEPSTGFLAVLGVATLAWRQRKRATGGRLRAGPASLPVSSGEQL
jgi:hypothetical protein